MKSFLRIDPGKANTSGPPRALSPHIPNAHARVTLPTQSHEDANAEAEHDEHGELLEPAPIDHIKKALRPLSSYLETSNTSGESARDFLARERTLFSWVRMSMLLSVASSALFLRLQLKSIKSPLGRSASSSPSSESSFSVPSRRKKRSTSSFQRALEKKAARRALSDSGRRLAFADEEQEVLPLQRHLYKTALASKNGSQPSITWARGDESVIDTDIALSEGLGIVFFLLALAALIIGHIDYMHAERALEHADEIVPFKGKVRQRRVRSSEDGTTADVEGADTREAMHGRRHPRTDPNVQESREAQRDEQEATEHAAKRRAAAVRWHDARHARLAHSGRLVRIVEITIAVVVFATALTILVTSGKASVAPLPPDLLPIRLD